MRVRGVKSPCRVVVTGTGLVTPLGIGQDEVWSKLLNGDTGIQKLDSRHTVEGCNVSVAAMVSNSNVPAISTKISKSSQFGLLASELALRNANLYENIMNPTSSKIDKSRFGVSIGSGGIGPLNEVFEGYENLEVSYKKLSPFFVPRVLMNMTAGQVSIQYKLEGPCNSIATACAAGTHSIGDAFNLIRWGYADAMLCGGTEACITPLSIAGFSRMRALSVKGVDNRPSSPFDKDRDGFVIGEGSGILVLEELSVALSRKANIIAEILGYSMTGDGFHSTSPAPAESGGAQRAMKLALKDAGLDPDDISYVNAHATSTELGDSVETEAIDYVFQSNRNSLINPLYVSSTKGATGHLLGAAGAVETIFTCLSLRDGIIPQTTNLINPNPIPKYFSHVIKSPIKCPNMKYALKNSFGFGGTNGVLVLGKYYN